MVGDATAAFLKESGKKVQDWDYDEEEQVIILRLKGKDDVSDDDVFYDYD